VAEGIRLPGLNEQALVTDVDRPGLQVQMLDEATSAVDANPTPERKRLLVEPGPDVADAVTKGTASGNVTQRPSRWLQQSAAVKLRALRGAITVEGNDADSILDATDELVREVMARNSLRAEDLVSCIFTCTEDLDAAFPAEAARRLGLSAVPLLCAREIGVPGALPRVIRLMVHCYSDEGAAPQHVYLREAVSLREDLHGAQ
jgi:chorismate mutase